MLNNDVRLIGVITSDFEDATFNEQYPRTKFTIEVEKKYKGKYCNFEIYVSNKNKDIDTSTSLKGQTAIVNAYVDENKGFLKLFAQDISVIGFGRPKIKKVEPVEEIAPADEPVPEYPSTDDNDDLPF